MCNNRDCSHALLPLAEHHPADETTDSAASIYATEAFILCPQCDLTVQLPPIAQGDKAVCPRCHTTLSAHWNEPVFQPVFCAAGALFMLFLANLYPFVNMRVSGIFNQIRLADIPQALVSDNYESLALLFLLFVQLIPAFCMIAILLLCLRAALPYDLKVMLGRAIYRVKVWCMAEIFLAGVLVSFVKLVSYGEVGLGLSFYPYCLFCLLQLRAFQCLDRYWLWQTIQAAPALPMSPRIGEIGLKQGLRSCPCCMAILSVETKRCPRCFTIGYARRPNSVQWVLALLATSLIIYIPANYLPIMITEVLANPSPSNIMSGVIILWNSGSWPVALIIFVASIMVPSLKILAIAWLCYDVSSGEKSTSAHFPDRRRTQAVYNIIEFVGRWSMIDVFVIAVLSALVRMGNWMSVYPDIGSVLFASVVILTMIAAMLFDPRLLWDRESVAQSESKEYAHG